MGAIAPDLTGALVLRPEPGATDTIARLRAAGVDVLAHPLFTVGPVDWAPPDPAAFDALILTSANAVRHAGPQLHHLRALPALAVGEASAEAARLAGLHVAIIGEEDAAALLAQARAHGYAHPLHLAGRDRRTLPHVQAITVYASEPTSLAPGAAGAWGGRVALLHSARAARRFVDLVERNGVERASIAVAALSTAVAQAAGEGWATVLVADRPTDAALVARAAALIDPVARRVDKSRR